MSLGDSTGAAQARRVANRPRAVEDALDAVRVGAQIAKRIVVAEAAAGAARSSRLGLDVLAKRGRA